MARTPRSSPSRALVPVADPHCATNDCQRQQAEAQARIAAHMDRLLGPPDAKEGEEGEGYRALLAIGKVFARWEKACLQVRKHWKWLIPGLWFLSNFVSPELRVLLNQLLSVLIQNATHAAAAAAATGGAGT